jgi:hypothetical protein
VCLFYGAYAKHELILLRDITEALRAELMSIAFYDVGANVGQHTLFMSKFADEVVSFEPYEPVRTKLLQRLEETERQGVPGRAGSAERKPPIPCA